MTGPREWLILTVAVAAVCALAVLAATADAHRWAGTGMAPDWFKPVAASWAAGTTTDREFYDALSALSTNGILKLPIVDVWRNNYWHAYNLTPEGTRTYFSDAGLVTVSTHTVTVAISRDCNVGEFLCFRPSLVGFAAPGEVLIKAFPSDATASRAVKLSSDSSTVGYAHAGAEPLSIRIDAPGAYRYFVEEGTQSPELLVQVSEQLRAIDLDDEGNVRWGPPP